MMILRGIAAIAVLFMAFGSPAAQAQDTGFAPSVENSCSALAGLVLPGAVHITKAIRVSASSPNAVSSKGLPGHCLVEGMINERVGFQGKKFGIGFALALPDNWAGRLLLQGGGGLNGVVNAPLGGNAAGGVPALAQGFAVISHDSGHKGEGFQQDFRGDQRASLDFAGASMRTVTEASKVIVERYYSRPVAFTYMSGCSTGGREAMQAAQLYPELFDGVIVGAPAMRTGNSNLAIAYSTTMFNQAAPRNSEGKPIVERIFTDSDRALILKGLLDQCDGLDGLKDGMVMDVKGCRFSPAKLQCKPGNSEGCLSEAQVTAMNAAFAGPKDKAGYPLYVPVPYDTGIVSTATNAIPGYLPSGRPGPFGPANQALSIDLDARIQTIRADASQRMTDTSTWTNLSTFINRGGKILFYHGVSDPWFSAFDTLDYWQRAEQANGAAWKTASRFYMAPGLGHCGSGNAFDTFDMLTAVVDWVENDKAPEAVLSSRTTPELAERPMCPWPSYAHFTGGDPRRSESFTCRMAAN
jgi:pimeloyl-ACP methyl ester carboxylesterase